MIHKLALADQFGWECHVLANKIYNKIFKDTWHKACFMVDEYYQIKFKLTCALHSLSGLALLQVVADGDALLIFSWPRGRQLETLRLTDIAEAPWLWGEIEGQCVGEVWSWIYWSHYWPVAFDTCTTRSQTASRLLLCCWWLQGYCPQIHISSWQVECGWILNYVDVANFGGCLRLKYEHTPRTERRWKNIDQKQLEHVGTQCAFWDFSMFQLFHGSPESPWGAGGTARLSPWCANQCHWLWQWDRSAWCRLCLEAAGWQGE